MNKKIFTLIIAALLMSNVSFGKIFRVGYTGPQIIGVDFATVNDAVNVAAANDTIQIYPGSNYYNIGGLSKKLFFIGLGYFLDKNSNLQVVTTSATLNVTNPTASASGSIFEGLEIIQTINATSGLLDNILFSRCKITSSQIQLSTSGDSIRNMTFSQCFFTNGPTYYSVAGTKITGFQFLNCIFSFENYWASYSNDVGGIITNFTFENCSGNGYPAYVNYGNVSTYYRNCIFEWEPITVNNDLFDYCTFQQNNASHYVAGSSNQFGKSFTDIFSGDVTTATGWDAGWTLKAGSPALAYGRDNSNNPIDAGAFGGVNPYKLSGIPPVPAFYKLTAPSSSASTNPYTITFSVKANN